MHAEVVCITKLLEEQSLDPKLLRECDLYVFSQNIFKPIRVIAICVIDMSRVNPA
jgi:hypothetical protein